MVTHHDSLANLIYLLIEKFFKLCNSILKLTDTPKTFHPLLGSVLIHCWDMVPLIFYPLNFYLNISELKDPLKKGKKELMDPYMALSLCFEQNLLALRPR